MNKHPNLAPIIDQLPATVPFVGPEVIERRTGVPFRARLGANENAFGPSPKVIAAIAAAAGDVWIYGDSEIFAVRSALSTHLQTPMETISVGEGIDALLGLVCRLFLAPGDRVVTSLGAYPTFNYHVAAQGGVMAKVPYQDDHESLEGLLQATRVAPAKIVYLANPDNPMGTWWSAAMIAEFIDAVPEETLIVLDEAYGETAPAGSLPPTSLIRPNLLRFRTFSKAYGLAGMRIGYCLGPRDIIAAFDRIRNHFGVNKLAQVAALAALEDQPYLTRTIEEIAKGRARIIERAGQMGLAPVGSATNFVAIDCGNATRAQAVLNGLLDHGIFVRKPTVPPLDRCIRLSVGTPSDVELACDTLEAVLHA